MLHHDLHLHTAQGYNSCSVVWLKLRLKLLVKISSKRFTFIQASVMLCSYLLYKVDCCARRIWPLPVLLLLICFINLLPCRIPQPAPCVSYSGKLNGMDIHVVWNGKCDTHGVDNVGTVPAALSTYLACAAFKPDVVISAGTAGGFKAQGAKIGDIFISKAVVNHDRRIPIPSFDAYGMGRRPTHACPNLIKELGLKEGVVSSGEMSACGIGPYNTNVCSKQRSFRIGVHIATVARQITSDICIGNCAFLVVQWPVCFVPDSTIQHVTIHSDHVRRD